MRAIIAACLIAVALAFAAHADTIYFKDGSKTICQERAGEEKDQVKCEYAGRVIICQKKKDVLRILKTTPSKQPAKIEKKPQNLTNPNLNFHNPDVAPKAAKASGMVFYNPRRSYPYRTDPSEKIKSYREAENRF